MNSSWLITNLIRMTRVFSSINCSFGVWKCWDSERWVILLRLNCIFSSQFIFFFHTIPFHYWRWIKCFVFLFPAPLWRLFLISTWDCLLSLTSGDRCLCFLISPRLILNDLQKFLFLFQILNVHLFQSSIFILLFSLCYKPCNAYFIYTHDFNQCTG